MKSIEKGIDYLLEAQLDIGGWPQVYPKDDSYRDASTFNDDANLQLNEKKETSQKCNLIIASSAQAIFFSFACINVKYFSLTGIIPSPTVSKRVKTSWNSAIWSSLKADFPDILNRIYL